MTDEVLKPKSDEPNPHDPELVNHPEVFKYIGIHGYEKFQADKSGRLHDGSSAWIKDSCRKDQDKDYCRLTCLQRYVLDGCRRLRGGHNQNPSNNATTLVRQLCVLGTDRPHVRHAICTLITRGLLFLTNEPLNSLDLVTKETYIQPPAAPGRRATNKKQSKGNKPVLRAELPGCPNCLDPARNMDQPGHDQYGDMCSCVRYFYGEDTITQDQYLEHLLAHDYTPMP